MTLRRPKLVLFLVVAAAMTSVPAAVAATPGCTVHWVNPAGGDWATASNWSPARVPALADNVCVSGAAALTVSLSVPTGGTSVSSLAVGGNATLAVHSAGPNLATLQLPNGGTIGRHATLVLSDTTSAQGEVVLATASHSSPLLTNRGTILIQTLPGSALIGATLASGVLNLGTFHASGGAILFGTFVNRGSVVVDSGQTVFPVYPGNNVAFENEKGGSISGAGLVDVSDTTFVENGGAVTGTPVRFETSTSIAETTLLLTGGGPAHFEAHGRLVVSGTLARAQSIDVNGGSLLTSIGTLTNAGTITLSACSGGILTSGGAVVNTGTLDVLASCGLFGSGPFTNQGHINIGNQSMLSIAALTFANAGGTMANAGMLVIGSGTFQQGAGRVQGNAATILGPSTLDLVGSGAGSFTLIEARLAGNVAPGQNLDIEPGQKILPGATALASFTNAGTISLNAPLALPAGATLTNSGQLSTVVLTFLDGGLVNTGLLKLPAHTGLAVTGPVVTSGTLEIGIAAPNGQGWLDGNGAVTLSGTLKVDTGSLPGSGQTFNIVSGTSLSGSFASTNFGNVPYTLAYSPTQAVLTAP